MDPPSEVTQLLQQWNDGPAEALDRLLPQIYAELRRLAGYLYPPRVVGPA
jgi:ECF sigma factor